MKNLNPIYLTILICYLMLFVASFPLNWFYAWIFDWATNHGDVALTERINYAYFGMILPHLILNCLVLSWGFRFYEKKIQRILTISEMVKILLGTTGLLMLGTLFSLLWTAATLPNFTIGELMTAFLYALLSTSLGLLAATIIIIGWRYLKKANSATQRI